MGWLGERHPAFWRAPTMEDPPMNSQRVSAMAGAVGVMTCCLLGRAKAGEPKPLPYPPSAVRVIAFDTDKVLYDEGEPVVFRCEFELSNAGASLVPSRGAIVAPPLVVEVWDEHGLARPVKVAQARFAPKEAGKPAKVKLTWQPGAKRFGHQAHLRVSDATGRRLAEASTLYEICRDWQYVIRLGATAAMNLVHEGMTEPDLRRIVAHLRRGCVNTVELYQTVADYYDMTPDEPTWRAAGYRKPRHRKVSAKNIKRFGRLLRAAGIKMVVYTEASALNPKLVPHGEQAEDYRVYRRDGKGKLRLHAPYHKDEGWFMPNILKVTDRFARDMAESTRRFGWDGLFVDSATQAFFATANGLDAKGNRLTDLTSGQVGKRYFDAVRKAVLPVNPQFRVICQNIAANMLLRRYHWREPEERVEQVTGAYMRKHFGELFGSIDSWSGEMDPHYGNQKAYPQTYDKYAHVLNIGRAVSGKPILLWMHVSNPHIAHEYTPEYVRPLLSVLAASRVSWHDHFSNYGGWWGPWRDAPVNRVQTQIHRFVTRFGKYLRAPDLRWIRKPETILEVDSSRDLLWRRTVYERTGPDGSRELTVNLINLDSPLLRPSNKNQPPHQVPPVAFPVTVRCRVPKGVDPASVRAHVMDAEDDSLRPLALRPALADGRATFQIPPVRSWQMLVVRYSRGLAKSGR
jgi:hypothetical protein